MLPLISNAFFVPLLGTSDAESAPDGPDSGAEEAAETSGTRGEGRRPGGHHHRYGSTMLPGGVTR